MTLKEAIEAQHEASEAFDRALAGHCSGSVSKEELEDLSLSLQMSTKVLKLELREALGLY